MLPHNDFRMYCKYLVHKKFMNIEYCLTGSFKILFLGGQNERFIFNFN